jgi:hypothetical protein
MESGEWSVENGKWRVENGKWKMENGKWKMKMESGAWKLENRKGFRIQIIKLVSLTVLSSLVGFFSIHKRKNLRSPGSLKPSNCTLGNRS